MEIEEKRKIEREESER